MGVTKSAISKLRQKGVTLGEEVATKGDWGKGGSKKLFSEEESQWAKSQVQRSLFLSAAQLKKRDTEGILDGKSTRRVTENLQRQGLSVRKAAKNLNLTHAMVDKRLARCRQIEDWT